MRRIQAGKEFYSPTIDTDKRKTIAGSLNLNINSINKISLVESLRQMPCLGLGRLLQQQRSETWNKINLNRFFMLETNIICKKGNRYGANLYYVSTP